MGTWINHLRIAENLLAQIPSLDEVMFTYGNLAPDSGLPNEDWTEFDPPKSVSHYILDGAGESSTWDLIFYREYLTGIQPVDAARYSFMLGYFAHLVCDHLAAERIAQSSRVYFPELFQSMTAIDAWDVIKTDWYGLDHRYIRDNPKSLFWRIFLPAPIPNSPIPFLPQTAFIHQMTYIKDYYSNPDSNRVLDRPFLYCNEETMSRFIEDTTNSILKILIMIQMNKIEDWMNSAVELLSPAEREPYPPPLGDSIA